MPGGPNIATGPVGWEALFKAFNGSPNVGLQFDPSHLVWQFMDPVQAARDFADKIYDVHLKDTEILWHVVRKRAAFSPSIKRAGGASACPAKARSIGRASSPCCRKPATRGAMNIENEDEFYYPAYDQGNFTEQYKRGFRVAHEFLKTLVPPVTA